MAGIIVVHGTPGAGKGTHSRRLAEYSNEQPIFHISIGDRLREIRTSNVESVFSDVIKSPEASSMLDHNIVNGVVFEFISQCPDNSVVLVDGYPRFPDAVENFLKGIETTGHTLLGCINLDISLETSISRISNRGVRSGERMKGRSSSEFAEKRYADHLQYTVEAVRMLAEAAPLVTVDAEGSVEEVWRKYNEAFQTLIDI